MKNIINHLNNRRTRLNKRSQECYSIQSLLSYHHYDPATEIFYNQSSNGFGLCFNPTTGCDEASINILTTLFSDILAKNKGANLQVLLWASPRIGKNLDRILAYCSKRGGEAARLMQLQSDFLKKSSSQSLVTGEDYHLRNTSCFIFFSVPKKNLNCDLQTLNQSREAIKSLLQSIHIQTRNMTITDLMQLLFEFISPNHHLDGEDVIWNPFDPIKNQVSNQEQLIIVEPQNLIFKTTDHEFKVRTLSVKQFPKQITQWQMNDAIGQLFNSALQIPCPFLLSLNIHSIDSEKAQRKIQSKILSQDNKAKNSKILNWLPSLKREYADWKWVQERLQDGDQLIENYFQIVLFSEHNQMDHCERKLKDLYQANGWKLYCESYLQLPAFLAVLPMMVSEGLYQDLKYFGRYKTMTAFNTANILPIQGEWKGHHNPLLILPGRRGEISGWSPFANDQGNYNVAIAAGSGKGKSALVQYYLTALLGANGRCWVIDIGHSYEKTCKLLDGEFIAFDLENPVCLNFFTALRNEADFKENLPLFVPLVACMARQKSDTSEEEDRLIEKAITQAWQCEGNKASITSIKEYLEKDQHPLSLNLAHLLTSYAKGGMYADFFEGQSTIALDNPFIVLELLGLKNKKTLQRVVLLALITRIHQAMYLSNRQILKSCVIDEAWDLLNDENGNAAKFIETGYRTARRHNGNFISITQSINDYYQNNTAQAAFMNADFTIVLGQKPQDIERLEKNGRFPMNDFTKRLLNSLRMVDKTYSECVIQSPQGLSLHRIILAPYIRVLFSSKGPEYERVRELQAQGHSLHEAVLKVAANAT